MRIADVRSPAAAAIAAAAFLAVLSGSGLLIRGGPVGAQEKPAAVSDATAVVANLDDIERLRILNALKLQPDQIDKLVTALTTAQADYDKKVNALGAAVFASSAADVRDVKKQVLGGGAVPKEFEDKMKKLQADFLKQRDDLNTANIQKVAAACRSVFTDRQITVATKAERDLWEKDHPDPKSATDVQLFNLYCVDMFISNPRAVPLLKEMRAAAK
jgi:hypothetical protein